MMSSPRVPVRGNLRDPIRGTHDPGRGSPRDPVRGKRPDLPRTDQPTWRQWLHAATGDREAEARALSTRSGISLYAARKAVNRAHGESVERVHTQWSLATPADARQVDDERP